MTAGSIGVVVTTITGEIDRDRGTGIMTEEEEEIEIAIGTEIENAVEKKVEMTTIGTNQEGKWIIINF